MTSLSSFPTTVTITKYPQYSSYHFFFRHPLKTSSKDLRGIYFGREKKGGEKFYCCRSLIPDVWLLLVKMMGEIKGTKGKTRFPTDFTEREEEEDDEDGGG